MTPVFLVGTLGASATLVAIALAGLLWDRFGSEATCYAGAAFAAVALVGLPLRPPRPGARPT